MNKFQNKALVEFVTSLCRATAKESIPDAIREAHKEIVKASLKAHTFIPEEFYEVDGDFYKPNSTTLGKWHDYLNSGYSILVPFRVYCDSIELGQYVLQDRTTTEERLKLVNSALEFLVVNNELITDRPNNVQLKFTNTLGILYNHLVKSSGINYTTEDRAINFLSSLPTTEDRLAVLTEVFRLMDEKKDWTEGEDLNNLLHSVAYWQNTLANESSTYRKAYNLPPLPDEQEPTTTSEIQTEVSVEEE